MILLPIRGEEGNQGKTADVRLGRSAYRKSRADPRRTLFHARGSYWAQCLRPDFTAA